MITVLWRYGVNGDTPVAARIIWDQIGRYGRCNGYWRVFRSWYWRLPRGVKI